MAVSVRFKLDAFLALVLAGAFYGFFMFTKHDPMLSSLIPFGSDPYDAIGSFGMVVSALLALLALFRALRPGSSSPARDVYLARTVAAVALAVLVPLGADVVAMVRHLPVWTGRGAAGELVALMLVMAALAAALIVRARRSVRDAGPQVVLHAARTATVVSLLGLVALAVYPESVILSVPGELFSLAAGIVIFFVCQSVLTVALVPYDPGDASADAGRGGLLSRRWVQWCVAAALGLGVGVVALAGEASGGGISIARLLVVASVFIGTGAVGILTGYYCLRKPLGLFRW
jgi:hypothetical protein